MKIAVIGAGAVGVTAAYYLSKQSDIEVTVFDDGIGQATKAAAGIISPWFSRRRNKAWYRVARLGADFYPILLDDLKKDDYSTDFYEQTGVFLMKSRPEWLRELHEIAENRKKESPLIGELSLKTYDAIKENYPALSGFDETLYASGAARVDGALLTATLLKASGVTLVSKKVSLTCQGSKTYQVDGQIFDGVILACGAWLGDILTPLGYQVDVRPQKGQLRDYVFSDLDLSDYPVLMPEGEIDLIPFRAGKISIGASHENDMGFDLTIDDELLDRMELAASHYIPALSEAGEKSARVGTRAYTSDYCPFFGQVPDLANVYVASGLGSTGLTIGPLIGQQLAKALVGEETEIDFSDYNPAGYIVNDK